MPSPQQAVAQYEQALQAGDVDALWSMMTAEAQARISKEELRALLKQGGQELKDQAAALSDKDVIVTGQARLFLADGRRVDLALEQGQFHVQAEGVLPAPTRSPMDAAYRLREAIRARNFEMARGVLSRDGRHRLEIIFEALEKDLEGLDLAVVEQRGETAVIELPEGRSLIVRLENGSWVVEELE